MQPLTAELAGYSLTLPSEPYLALLALACLGLVVLALRGLRMAMGKLHGPPWEAWLWVGWLSSGIGVALLLSAGVETGDVLWALPELHHLIQLTGAVGWLSVSAVAVEAWRVLRQDPPVTGWHPGHWVALPPMGVLGVALASGCLWVRQSWAAVQVPALTVQGCEEVHQGLACAPVFRVFVLGREPVERTSGFLFKRTQVTLPWFTGSQSGSMGRSFEDLGGWQIPEQPIPTARLGSVEHTFYAIHGPLMVRKTLGGFTVTSDRGDPRLQAVSGATFHYGTTETRSQRVILLKHDSHSWDGPSFTVQIGERLERGGVYVYPVYSRRGEDAPKLEGHLQQSDGVSYWLSGELRAPLFPERADQEVASEAPLPPPPISPMPQVDDRQEEGEEAVSPPEVSEPLPQTAVYEGLPEGHEECTVPWMRGLCVCAPAQSLPEQDFAGPIQCAYSHDGAGVGETLFMGFLALVTLGLTPGVPHSRTEILLLRAGVEPLWGVAPPPPAL